MPLQAMQHAVNDVVRFRDRELSLSNVETIEEPEAMCLAGDEKNGRIERQGREE